MKNKRLTKAQVQELEWFCGNMKLKLSWTAQNTENYDWAPDEIDVLLKALLVKFKDIERFVAKGVAPIVVIDSACELANYAMMVAANYRRNRIVADSAPGGD